MRQKENTWQEHMASKPISVELGAKQQAILRQQLDSGRYEDASEVVNDALRLMSERDAVFDEWLRGKVTAALGDKRPPVPIEDVFKRLEARHTRRVRATKRGSK
jgi:antitoxin ParD1/3/4